MRILLPALCMALLVSGLVSAQDKKPIQNIRDDPTKITDGSLELVGVFARKDLGAPTSVEVSPDGKFLYASAWRSATHVVFKRDQGTGKLHHVQTITDPVLLDGATDLRLSNDGALAVAAAFRSQSVVLYARDPASGKLSRLDSKQQKDPGISGLGFPIGAQISPDNRFVYVLDSNGGLTAFELTGKGMERKLKFVEANAGADLRGIRGLAFHPSGKVLFAACYQAHTLVVLDRDPATGKTKVRQVLRGGVPAGIPLVGAFGVSVSPDGKFVYTVSGRFGGSDAVGVYSFDPKKQTLSTVQEFLQGKPGGPDPLAGFEGGNEITVSPDGRNVYAVATKGGAVATFSRDQMTGKLKVVEVIRGKNAVAGAAGVTLSPDRRFVYIAAEEHGAVSVFRRK
jgi:6-phosphogluconolactonase (cycloisomerase 2 family)